jgi:hypothetical protein
VTIPANKLEWRLDVNHAALYAPGTEPVCVDAPLDGDRAILMPAQRPVLLRALVKKNGADRKTRRTEQRRRNLPDRTGRIEERS